MAVTISSNMNLPIPTVGSQPGPEYAQNVNDSLTLVDSHDHTPGKGVQLGADSLNISTALTLNGNFLEDVAGVTLVAQGSVPANGTVYRSGVDLYYVDGLGNNIQITQNGGVGGAPGSISNLNPPASAAYVGGSSKFVWQSNTNIAADMDFGAAIMRNLSPNSTFALTLQPPAGLVSNYSITLPTLPVATSFMTISSAGIISASPNLLGALTTANLSASAGILGTQIDTATIAKSNLEPEVLQWTEVTLTPVTPTFTVKAATTANITLSGAQTIDGISCVATDKVLVKNQTLAANNGVYVVAAGAWSRDTDYDTYQELNYAAISVTSGTINGGKSYFQNNILTSLADPQSWSLSSTQAWTVPAGVDGVITIKAIAGGGGGGGSGGNNAFNEGTGGGGGGSGGEYKIFDIIASEGDVLNVTIGNGGAGGAGGAGGVNGANGTTGGNTVVFNDTDTFTLYGGPGGGGGGNNNLAGSAGTAFYGAGGTGGTSTGQAGGGGGGGGGISGDTRYGSAIAPAGNGGNNFIAGTFAAAFSSAGGGGGGGGNGAALQTGKDGGAGGSSEYAQGGAGGLGGQGSGGISPGGAGGGAGFADGGAGGNGLVAGNAGSLGSGGGGGGGRQTVGVGLDGGDGGNGIVYIYYLGGV